jgi:hypothetical protein
MELQILDAQNNAHDLAAKIHPDARACLQLSRMIVATS